MKKNIFFVLWIVLAQVAIAQKVTFTSSEIQKAPSDASFPQFIGADASGIYTMQLFIKKSLLMSMDAYKPSLKINRYRDDLSLDVENIYETRDMMQGRTADQVFLIGDFLYVFASEYNAREKQYTLSASKIDKKTGEMSRKWVTLGGYSKENRRDIFDYGVVPGSDSSYFVLAASISGGTEVMILDLDFKKALPNPIHISYEKGIYELDDIVITSHSLLLAGKMFETDSKKKKKIFSSVLLSRYSLDGKKIMDIPVDSSGRIVTSIKIVPAGGQVLLAGFYTADAKQQGISGVYVSKLDLNANRITGTSFKPVNTSMIGKTFDEDKDADDEEKGSKDDNDDDDLSDRYTFSKILFNPSDNSIFLMAEYKKYREMFSHDSRPYANTMTNTQPVLNTAVYMVNCDNIIVIKVNAGNEISWMNMIPKKQMEYIDITQYNATYTTPTLGSYFDYIKMLPFYSSFSATLYKDKLLVLLNDHPKNAGVTSYDSKASRVTGLRKSDAFAIFMDTNNGKYSRTTLFSNKGEPVFMPRFSSVKGNIIYTPAIKYRRLASPQMKFLRFIIH
jgi:hypothetical protein